MKKGAVTIVKLSKEESDRMVDEAIEKNRRDRVAEREYAREEGLEEGIKQGMKKGLEQGIALAALNMLKTKTDIGFISKMTGLSKEKILKLKKNLK